MKPKPHEVTRILRSLDLSDREQGERLMALVYDELRVLAASHLRRERAGHTLRTTALVHEAYIKLVDSSEVGFANRGHFFGCAARAMRHIHVDHAREHGAQKRGGGWERVMRKTGRRVHAPPRSPGCATGNGGARCRGQEPTWRGR